MITTGIDGLTLRRWHTRDISSLVRFANNRHVWINLKDRFPHPYTDADAQAWIADCAARTGDPTTFAIDLDGTAIGGIGLEPFADVHRLTATIGYWLGEPFWGRGFTTAAVKALTTYAFSTFDLHRLQADVFDWNRPSARVLEKAGYTLEARLRRNIIKDGRIADTLLYARLRDP